MCTVYPCDEHVAGITFLVYRCVQGCIFALIRKQLGIPDEYVNLSVRRKLPDEFIGPPTPSKGFVTYSKNSSGSVEVKSIGNSFKGVSALIAATRRSRKDE